MQVSVRFFSHLRLLFDAQQIVLNLPEKARIADLSQRLQELYPQHSALIETLIYMIDEKSAHAQTELAEGAQVSALLMLSGG